VDPRVAAVAALLAAPAAWRWQALLRTALARRRRRGRRVRGDGPSSTLLINALGTAVGVLVASALAPRLVAVVTAVLGVTGTPPWLAAVGPLALAGAVAVGVIELVARGLRPRTARPRLAHFPLALLLPAVAVAVWPLVGQGVGAVPATAAAQVVAPAALVCAPPGGPVGPWRGRQLVHAAAIVATGREMGVSERGQVVAVATAMQESTLRVLANPRVPASLRIGHDGQGTDHDSVGLFQQRRSWGTTAELMDPRASAAKFYERLLALPDWQDMALSRAAQAVQRSAYPDRYARWETDATAVVAAVGGAVCTDERT